MRFFFTIVLLIFVGTRCIVDGPGQKYRWYGTVICDGGGFG